MAGALFSLNLSYWVLQTAAMLLTALIIPKLRITSIFGAVGIVVAVAFVNSKVWDAALFFHIPDRLSLHVLLLILTNGIIFWALIKLLPGIEVEGLLPALAAPLVFTCCSLLVGRYAGQVDWVLVLDFLISCLQSLRGYFNDHLSSAALCCSLQV